MKETLVFSCPQLNRYRGGYLKNPVVRTPDVDEELNGFCRGHFYPAAKLTPEKLPAR